ncbi:MAG TPA: glycoside hydrolase family 3 N-terminal domain-containing protein [Lachnospiraceae bacterium]|nr:glycoside hydrolase family 3 N-terminal domain-containing protein [Lachnospiraceae bacterium]
MVDLKAKPYNLDTEAIKWVENIISSMTLEEKIGQLFVNMGSSRDEDYLKDVVTKYKFGAVRYNPALAAEIHEQNCILQENSKIPLLIAANTEAGGNGACTDGTEIGLEIKIGATNDPKYAYEMGRISGIEAAAVGCNWSFAPIVDINRNWRNPIISSRTFGQDADKVLAYSNEYMRGFMESNMVCAMKHFPGDGIDERDQHLSNSVNSLSREEWDQTFGKVYSGMIEAGIHSVMAGHIMMPAYQKYFNPKMKDEDTMPATLSKELITDLLKGKLGFNGLVVTDASHMVGLTAMMKRRDILPAAIAAGCDLFLFYNDPEEDLAYMMEGYQNGTITEERLQDALMRILGIKAYLGLHKKEKKDIVPPREGLKVIGSEEFKNVAKEVSDKAITLVKNKENLIPISPKKDRRILLIPQETKNAMPFHKADDSKKSSCEYLKEKLEAEGFQVEIYQSVMDEIAKLSPAEASKRMTSMYAAKAPITAITDKYDLIIQVAFVMNMFGTVNRIGWKMSKGTPDIPWYVHEVPTIFISLSCPFHLADVPQVKTYINTYDKNEHTLDALIEKLVGRSEFKGVDPVDSFCGLPDTRW